MGTDEFSDFPSLDEILEKVGDVEVDEPVKPTLEGLAGRILALTDPDKESLFKRLGNEYFSPMNEQELFCDIGGLMVKLTDLGGPAVEVECKHYEGVCDANSFNNKLFCPYWTMSWRKNQDGR